MGTAPAREAHSDHCTVRPVPHERGQLRDVLFPGTHQGVSGCLSCHGPTVNTTFLNVTMVTTTDERQSHPDRRPRLQNGSGCQTTSNVTREGTASGSALGTASIHESHRSTLRANDGDGSRRLRELPRNGEFPRDDPEHGAPRRRLSSGGVRRPAPDHWRLWQLSRHPADLWDEPAFPRPRSPAIITFQPPPCAQCHTTAGNFALYSVTGTHQGVTGCLSCHGTGVGPSSMSPWSRPRRPAITSPIGSLDCNRLGLSQHQQRESGRLSGSARRTSRARRSRSQATPPWRGSAAA